MADKSSPRRLSETVVPGKDYPKKVKIDTVLDQNVLILNIEKVTGSKEFALTDAETGEIIIRDYWNVTVEMEESALTFSTGATPIDIVFTKLLAKLQNDEAELPVTATFRQAGRTYIVE